MIDIAHVRRQLGNLPMALGVMVDKCDYHAAEVTATAIASICATMAKAKAGTLTDEDVKASGQILQTVIRQLDAMGPP